MDERSRNDWSSIEPGSIPTKVQLPQLDRWLDERGFAGARVIDVGCGAGAIASLLLKRGLHAVGVDINRAALEHCRAALPSARFYERDVAAASGLALAEAAFDLAVCQLVASVVGDAADRLQLARNIRDALVPAGRLFMSFSGLSHDVNAAYAALYERDRAATGTFGSYESRDASGKVLYRTHHFSEAEIRALLAAAGFIEVAIETVIEASSRRPDQRARFYYANARRA